VVTGGGRGLGRAYALLLAERGARVVVNDLGGSVGGEGADAGPAARVAEEIVAAGGAAIADGSDVADPAGAAALVGAAVDRFGRLDALVNNAGIVEWAGFPDIDEANLAHHLDVHVHGSFNTALAAWPHLVASPAARVVMTASAGIFGLADNTSYATAKGGVLGLTRSLALAGAPQGIAVNAVAPAAWTRMAGPVGAGGAVEAAMAPELAAPLVAYLAHPECTANGEVYTAGAGRFARLFLAVTPGWVAEGAPSMEDVARHWEEIGDEAGYVVPADLPAWSAAHLAHLGPEDHR
jgi:NAD(P)-dependent dehydrogenase (short-subunit alcohol dehydrogenase family)